MRPPHRASTLPALLSLTLVAAVAGCGSSGPAKPANGLEKSELTVGTLPIVDDAAFFIAQRDGYFAEQGLKVRQVTLANGAEGLVRLQSGNVDVAWTSYPTVVIAAESGVARPRIIVDGYATTDHLFPVLVAPSSPIHDKAQLAGEKLAVNSQKGLGPLLLSAAGIAPKSLRITEMPFPNMPAALQGHAVDAIWVTEPFATQTVRNIHAREVADTSAGEADDLPIAGFTSSARTVAKEPKALAAFRRAMARAQRVAQDRNQVEKILPTYVRGLTPRTASRIVIGHYATSLSRARLQRVPDLMLKYHLITHRLDIGRLLPTGLPG